MPEVRPAQPLALEPDAALAELLEAIRRGGREAYRRLLELLRELQDARARQRRSTSRRWPSSRASRASCSATSASTSTPPSTPRRSRTPRPRSPRRSCRQGLVAEAMRGGGDGLPLLRGITAQTIAGIAGEEQVLVFAERVRCLRQLAAHAARAPRRRGARRRRLDHRPRVRGAQAALHAPASSRSCASSRVGQEGHNLQNASRALPPRPAVAARRARAARRPRRPPRRRARLGADLHPLHPRRRHRAHRLDPLPARRRAPPGPRLLRGRRRRRLDRRHPARRRSPARSPSTRTHAGYAGTAARLRVAASVFGA